jgi:hypothetical protein
MVWLRITNRLMGNFAKNGIEVLRGAPLTGVAHVRARRPG